MNIQTYAQLSAHVYHKKFKHNRMTLPDGFEVLKWEKDHPVTGFSVGAYKKGEEIVISFAGTNEQDTENLKTFLKDWQNNGKLGLASVGWVLAPTRSVLFLTLLLFIKIHFQTA